MLTKKQTTRWNKPEKTKSAFGTKKYHLKKKSIKALASDEDRQYLQFMKDVELSCIVCGSVATDLHHLRFDDTDRVHVSTGKRDHTLIVPICFEHHLGAKCSFHGNKKELAKRFTKESLITISKMYYEQYLEYKGL